MVCNKDDVCERWCVTKLRVTKLGVTKTKMCVKDCVLHLPAILAARAKSRGDGPFVRPKEGNQKAKKLQ